MATLTLTPPNRFSFSSTVLSHGWCDLQTFALTIKPFTLGCRLRLASGVVRFDVSHARGSSIELKTAAALTPRDRTIAKKTIAAMLAFDTDLTEAYTIAKREERFRWIVTRGAGRLLRAETMFEDVVKMILTTNCSWSLTKIMTNNLIETFSADPSAPIFPLPEQIADVSEKFLREKVKLGYRAPFVRQLARDVASGARELEPLRDSSDSADELYKQLRSILGVGEYAASNLLKLLGRFDRLGLDSWCRSTFSRMHARGTNVSDRTIERHYARFGKWKGLFIWLDLTRDWYFEKFPLAQ